MPGLVRRVTVPAGLIVAAIVGAIGLSVAWSRALPGVFFDDGIYVLLAQALAGGHGLHYLGVPGAPPAAKYPPLFPLALAAVSYLRSGAAAFPLFQLLNVALTAVGAGVFAWYLERGLRFPRLFAAGVALAAWITVDAWRYAVIPLSEPLFTLALALALFAAARLEQGRQTAGELALVLLTFAVAYYTRTIGVAAIVAAILALALRRRARPAAALALGAALLMLPWLIWSAAAARAVPPDLADVLGPYSGWLTRQLVASPGAFAASFVRSLPPLGERLLGTVLPGAPPLALALLALPVVLVAAYGGRDLWRRSPATLLAVALYIAVLALWPFVTRRLVAPVAPWLILLLAGGFLALARARSAGVRRAALVVGGAWSIWFVAASAVRLLERRHDDVLVERSAERADAAAAVRAATPPDAVIGSAELWAGIHLLTGRAVAPSARFQPVADAGTPVWGTPAAQLALWRRTGVSYLWVMPGAPVEGAALNALTQACGADAVRLVASSSRGQLLRLGSTPACPRGLPAPAGAR